MADMLDDEVTPLLQGDISNIAPSKSELTFDTVPAFQECAVAIEKTAQLEDPRSAQDRIDQINRIFAPGGPISQLIPGYSPRKGQVELAQNIGAVLANGGRLVAEAPTGSGKSWAALVPLFLASVRDKQDKPRVILTGTIALQDQYLTKDIPFIRQALLLETPAIGRVKTAVLKGLNQYLCEDKLVSALNRTVSQPPFVMQINEWAAETRDGSRSNLPLPLSDSVWSNYSMPSSECNPARCMFAENCFGRLARQRALQSDIVIANYHVVLVGEGLYLHNMSDVICDEAHELPKAARHCFTQKASPAYIRWLLSKFDEYRDYVDLSGELEDSQRILKEAERVFGRVIQTLEGSDERTRRLKRKGEPGSQDLADMIGAIANSITLAGSSGGGDAERETDLSLIESSAYEISAALEGAEQLLDSDEYVHYYELSPGRYGKGQEPSIVRTPYRSGGVIARSVMSREHRSVTLMSATLKTSSGFTFIRTETGLPSDGVTELTVKSPFNLPRQGALVVPDYMMFPPKFDAPEYEKTKFMDYSTAAIAELITALEGRTLCLFTSWYALEHAYRLLTTKPKTAGKFKFLKQGEAPVATLVDLFKTSDRAVLLGVASFWQGIDVPGDALKGVFIDKIPFPSPSEPINGAMGDWLDAEYGKGSSFPFWAVPNATVMLQQGMGRLIRTVTDTGIIMIADRRLTKTSYGKGILGALPAFSRFASLDAVRKYMPRVFDSRTPERR